jgi:hypothetical protein
MPAFSWLLCAKWPISGCLKPWCDLFSICSLFQSSPQVMSQHPPTLSSPTAPFLQPLIFLVRQLLADWTATLTLGQGPTHLSIFFFIPQTMGWRPPPCSNLVMPPLLQTPLSKLWFLVGGCIEPPNGGLPRPMHHFLTIFCLCSFPTSNKGTTIGNSAHVAGRLLQTHRKQRHQDLGPRRLLPWSRGVRGHCCWG